MELGTLRLQDSRFAMLPCCHWANILHGDICEEFAEAVDLDTSSSGLF